MKKRNKNNGPASETQNRKERVETAMVAGAVAGAAAGAIAGPGGALAGGILGGAAGAITGGALADDAERRHAHAHEIDREIGVTGDGIGAAPPDAPPSRVGAFSAGSAGAGAPSRTPSEGPISSEGED